VPEATTSWRGSPGVTSDGSYYSFELHHDPSSQYVDIEYSFVKIPSRLMGHVEHSVNHNPSYAFQMPAYTPRKYFHVQPLLELAEPKRYVLDR
jgi:hypothetical protein